MLQLEPKILFLCNFLISVVLLQNVIVSFKFKTKQNLKNILSNLKITLFDSRQRTKKGTAIGPQN